MRKLIYGHFSWWLGIVLIMLLMSLLIIWLGIYTLGTFRRQYAMSDWENYMIMTGYEDGISLDLI